MPAINPYQQTLIHPFAKIQHELNKQNKIGAAREGCNLVYDKLLPKSAKLITMDMANNYGFISLLSTASVAMFIICAIGAAGHLHPTTIGVSSALFGGAVVYQLGSSAITYWNMNKPATCLSAINHLIHMAVIGVALATVSTLALTGASSAACASSIGLATILGSNIVTAFIYLMISQLESMKQMEDEAQKEYIGHYGALILEYLTALEHIDTLTPTQTQNRDHFTTFLINTNPYEAVIQELETRLATLAPGDEKTSIEQTLALTKTIQNADSI